MRAVVPGWVDVSGVEDAHRDLIEVTLRVQSWWRRWSLSRFERAVVLSAAAVVAAESPAGLCVRVRWA